MNGIAITSVLPTRVFVFYPFAWLSINKTGCLEIAVSFRSLTIRALISSNPSGETPLACRSRPISLLEQRQDCMLSPLNSMSSSSMKSIRLFRMADFIHAQADVQHVLELLKAPMRCGLGFVSGGIMSSPRCASSRDHSNSCCGVHGASTRRR